MSKTLKLTKYPDRKQTALDVYDDETNIHYTVAYFKNEDRINLFLEALTSHRYVKDEKQYAEVMKQYTELEKQWLEVKSELCK
jgi:hypothetical protein